MTGPKIRQKTALRKKKNPKDDDPFESQESEPLTPVTPSMSGPIVKGSTLPRKATANSELSNVKLKLCANTNQHPANAAGIYKCTQAEIRASAAARKAVKDVQLKEKAELSARTKASEAVGIARLAVLEDARAEEELAEASDDADFNDNDEMQELGSDSEPEIEVEIKVEVEEEFPGDDMDVDDSESIPSKRTPSQKSRNGRKARSVEIREAISSRRTMSASSKRSVATLNLRDRPNVRSVKRLKLSADERAGIDANWKKMIKDRANRQILNNTMGALSVGGSTPAKKGSTSKAAQDLDGDIVTGFTDENVASSRPQLRLGGQAPVGRSTQLVTIQPSSKTSNAGLRRSSADLPSSAAESMKMVHVKTRGDVAVESRSQDSLPKWSQSSFKDRLLPTLVDFFGAQNDPWELNGIDGKLFSSVLKDIVKNLCPDVQYVPVRSGTDKLYTVARQQLSDLCRRFQTVAVMLVQKEVKARGQHGKAAIIKYIKDTLQPDNGVAYWAVSKGSNGLPEGAFLSDFIVKTLAEHIKATEGSQLEESSFPAGAFILSITAVMRAFCMFSTGAYINAGAFSKDNIGYLTTEWIDSPSVKTFFAKPHRQGELLDKIDDHLNKKPSSSHDSNSDERSHHGGLGKEAVAIVDKSSPPPMHEDD